MHQPPTCRCTSAYSRTCTTVINNVITRQHRHHVDTHSRANTVAVAPACLPAPTVLGTISKHRISAALTKPVHESTLQDRCQMTQTRHRPSNHCATTILTEWETHCVCFTTEAPCASVALKHAIHPTSLPATAAVNSPAMRPAHSVQSITMTAPLANHPALTAVCRFREPYPDPSCHCTRNRC